jgi:FkbM family methyltransferase
MTLAERIAGALFRRGLRGSTRFHQILCGGRRIRARTKHGIVLALDPHEYVDGFVLRHGFYEEEVLDAICASMSPRGCFWDVGSNLGLHALTVARRFPESKVAAFEPNPEMAALISDAAGENRLSAAVLKIALGAREGAVPFYIHRGNAGRSGLFSNEPGAASIEVTMARADRIAAGGEVPFPTVVKIDAEGGEEGILLGMGEMLSDRRLHAVIFEDSFEAGTGPKNILGQAGFDVYPLVRREDAHHLLGNFAATRK